MIHRNFLAIILSACLVFIAYSSLFAQNNISKTVAVQSYIESWKELDGSKRLKLIQSYWLKESTYLDPAAQIKGPNELNQMIEGFQKQFPNAILENDEVLLMGANSTWNWRIFDANRNLLFAGRDIVNIDDSGQILSLVGFWETQNIGYSNKKVVESYFQCLFKTGDFAKMATLIADGAVYNQAVGLPYGGTYVGFDNWMKMFGHAGGLFDLQIVDEPSYFLNEAENQVFIYFSIKCTSKKSGKVISMPISEHFELQDGKIVSIRPFYFDTLKFTEFLN